MGKRILWLLNHTTLRKAEVNLLREFGYEVFVPKIFPQDDANMSASVTYEYDDTLTIPENWLRVLNSFDFYSKNWPAKICRFINQNFDAVFVGFFPNLINQSFRKIKTKVFIRAFGLAGYETYSNLLRQVVTPDLIRRFEEQDNLWFSYAYPQIIDNEETWLKEKSVFLPVGIDRKFVEKYSNSWKPDLDKLFFVCPRILTSPYYNQVYHTFKSELAEFPHIIAGNQSAAVQDETVIGFLPDDEYYEMMQRCQVMFYHSQELRRLHYHPIEAIVIGLPLVYMADGCLDYLAGDSLPGRCESYEEAKQKIRRILEGDEEFINGVVENQKVILSHFDMDNVKKIWEKNFCPLPVEESFKSLEVLHVKPVNSAVKRTERSVGIWFNVSDPRLNLSAEGISRLQSFIIKACLDENVVVKIACLSWMRPSITKLLISMNCDLSKIIFIDQSQPPIVYQLYEKLSFPRVTRRERKYRKFVRNIRLWITNTKKHLRKKLVGARTVYDVLALSLFLLLSAPFIVLYFAGRILSRFTKQVFAKIRALVLKLFDDLKNRFYTQLLNLYHDMVQSEYARILENAANQKVSVWIFSYPRFNLMSKIQAPKILIVPDLVYLDFPYQYKDIIRNLHEFEDTIRQSTKVVTFSKYVAREHIVKKGYKSEKDVHIIRHGALDLSEYLRLDLDKSNNIKFRSPLIIKDYLSKKAIGQMDWNSRYVSGLPFGDFDYFFISSQVRPHKNYLGIVKAYNILLRKKYINYKLFLTGNIEADTSLREYVNKEELNFDVISVHGLPPQVHAAFYACASLTLVPTLFEGGFPFVFFESLSVGTPVLLSDIPVVQEVLPKTVIERICFDPYNVNEMVKKIEWAVNHKEELMSIEMEVYEKLRKRSWKDVALDYLDLINSMSEK